MLYIRNHKYRAVNNFHHGYKTNQSMTYKAKAAVCSETGIEHSMQSEHRVVFLNVKPGGT